MAAASSSSELATLQLALRHHTGTKFAKLTSSDANAASIDDAGFTVADNEHCHYSEDGKLFAVAGPAGISIVDTCTMEEVSAIKQTKIQALHWSPLGSYLLTWHKQAAEEENLCVWEVRTGTCIGGFKQKNFSTQAWPSMQFTGDELLIARGGNGRISFYSTTALAEAPAAGMAVPAFAAFSVSPGPAPYKVALVQKGAKGKPGSIALYRYPRLDREGIVAARSILSADSAEFEWAPDGTVVLATVFSDASDATYYGETTLALLTADGRTSAELSTGAMVHAVKWCPDSKKFVAITGNSPPKITMYNKTGKAVFSFGALYRNTVRWSPQGRFLMLGGFGGMAGEVDFWDVKTEKRLGTAKMNMVTDCEFSPCGRWFMTNTLYRRMKTDNGYKVYTHFGAGPVFKDKFERLHSVQWRPAPAGAFPDLPPAVEGVAAADIQEAPRKAVYRSKWTSGDSSTAAASGLGTTRVAAGKVQASVYVPPSSRGPPGASGPPGAGGGSQNKKRNKRAAKKQREEEAARAAAEAEETKAALLAAGVDKAAAEAAAAQALQAATAPQENVARTDGVSDLSELSADDQAKEKRKIAKKLRQVEQLEEKAAAGTQLTPAQQEKVSAKAELQASLTQLNTLLGE